MGKMQITIPQPCHESWDKMTQAEQGKFCGSCQKVVVDFSKMTDAELLSYFKKPKDSVCGRFKEEQLHRVITPQPKRLPWIKYFFQIAIPAFLFSMKASSQQRTLGRVVAINEDSIKRKDCVPDVEKALQGSLGTVSVNKQISEKTNVVAGKVVTESGEPIPFATVIIKGSTQGTACDSVGRFRLNYKGEEITVQVSAMGYETKELSISKDQLVEITMIALKENLMGEVVIIVRMPKVSTKKNKAVLIEKPKSTDTKGLSFYPNPALSGSEIHLEWKNAIGGEYELQFVSEAGIVVQKTFLEILHKSVKTNIHLPELTKGVYMVLMINKRTKTSYTSKLIIE
jgi:hypothetical protein